jgi:CBS domain containing-hemolysin-like protein
MIPMEKAHTIRGDASLDELLALSRKADVDRLPVTGDGGRITGIVNVFETLLELPRAANGRPELRANKVSACQRRIITVQAADPAYEAIRKVRAARAHIAVVENARTQIGIVTAEDLVKRLVSSAAR